MFVAKQDKLVILIHTSLFIIPPVQPRPQHALQVDRLVIHQLQDKPLTWRLAVIQVKFVQKAKQEVLKLAKPLSTLLEHKLKQKTFAFGI